MDLTIFFLTLASFLMPLTQSQTVLTAQVVSSFIYTRYGERTPWVLPPDPTLTPLGAQQMFRAGSNFRQRYVAPMQDTEHSSATTIRNISPYQLFHDEITVLSTDDQWVSASAQAFIQGLYPALAAASNYTYITGQSSLANGTNIVSPLDGYQYANIKTVSTNDLNSIWLTGSANCPEFDIAEAEYYTSASFEALKVNTNTFFNSLKPEFLNGYFLDSSVGYFDAYYIWDYLNYANIHNSTVADSITPEELTTSRILSDDLVFALNANTSVNKNGDQIGVIAGKTLATRILQAFYTTINSQGQSDKMTLLFGSFEPMVAFAALADLSSPQNAAFYDTPGPASSFIFELFAMRENDIGTYPETNDLFVRFLYQNGTDEGSSLVEYPLFGNSPSQTMMSLSEFISAMERIQIFNTEDWCSTCNSYSVFCAALEGVDGKLDPTRHSSSGHSGLSPAVAGVTGAIIALVVTGLVFVALMLLAGCRFRRNHTKRRSELGGFKGAEKLASDQDLTMPKGVAGVSISQPAPTAIRGHERVGSWELRDQAKAEEAQRSVMYSAQPRRPSYEDDDLRINPFTDPVKPHDHV